MSDRADEYPLIGSTKMDRLERHALSWPGTPAVVKQAIVARMAQLALSPSTMPREAVAAAKALLQADKLSYEVEKNLPSQRLQPEEYAQEDVDLTAEEIHCYLVEGIWPERLAHIK